MAISIRWFTCLFTKNKTDVLILDFKIKFWYNINMKNNKQGGFLEIIIFIIVVVLILSYLGIHLNAVVNYIVSAFHNVFG